jgi:2-keto-4-pentenoate hydratase/2-oxohepta-3-ene-1,7-dioic acid hydratase in catechol pathway
VEERFIKISKRFKNKKMRLIRFRKDGIERPGIISNDDRKFDVTDFGQDFDGNFFTTNGIEKLREWLDINLAALPELPGNIELAAPLVKPGKMICIGLNFSDHAKESGMEIPSEPIIFMKATSSVVGPNDDLYLPRGSVKTDWEVELAVVIGRKASYVSEADALNYVAGFVLHNDYSERSFQLERGGQWVKGKSCDSFAPLGPFLATKDEIIDFNNLHMWLRVNGDLKQNGNTSNMIFKVPFLISYLSQFMSLHPGDIISTGTPAGVGLGLDPQQFLKDGDMVELGIDYLGTSMQRVRKLQH